MLPSPTDQLDVIRRRISVEGAGRAPLTALYTRIFAGLGRLEGQGPDAQLRWLRSFLKTVTDGAAGRIDADRLRNRERYAGLADNVPAELNPDTLRIWLSARPTAADLLYEHAGMIHNQLMEWMILGIPLNVRILDGAEMLATVDPTWFWHFRTLRAWFMWDGLDQIWTRLKRIAPTLPRNPAAAWHHDGVWEKLPLEQSYVGYNSNWLYANCLQTAWEEYGVDHRSDLSRVWIKAARRARRRWLIAKFQTLTRALGGS